MCLIALDSGFRSCLLPKVIAGGESLPSAAFLVLLAAAAGAGVVAADLQGSAEVVDAQLLARGISICLALMLDRIDLPALKS